MSGKYSPKKIRKMWNFRPTSRKHGKGKNDSGNGKRNEKKDWHDTE